MECCRHLYSGAGKVRTHLDSFLLGMGIMCLQAITEVTCIAESTSNMTQILKVSNSIISHGMKWENMMQLHKLILSQIIQTENNQSIWRILKVPQLSFRHWQKILATSIKRFHYLSHQLHAVASNSNSHLKTKAQISYTRR